ncbi:MAG TPA: 2-oxo acid dehydrogenase subunit E2 [Anaerolineales bacterium]|nr:2-oxo acid dehydrogenase subunit E2 [Anaerolineales bacterium]HLO29155.1 2-oxo acid dehydrogenase subunit E2 [Anaerolineales bacterium]
MNQKVGPYHVVELPASRRETPNMLDIYWWKHSIYALLEVDVTTARQFISEHKERTGEGLSFTGWLAYCLARAVDEDKSVQAYLKGRKKLVMFDNVDVGLPVEREIGGKRTPIGYVIRNANHKTFLEIHKEIRAVQTEPAPPGRGMPRWLQFGLLFPAPLSTLFVGLLRAAIRWDPTITVAQAGTVGVTSVGMFGKGRSSGWGLTPPMHSLFLIVGGISRKPAVVDDRIEPREILNLTIGFNHDVVDGGPAARFVHRLLELIEGGYGLMEVKQAMRADVSVPA